MWLFIVGGALTVTVTFIAVAAFARGGVADYAAARWRVPGTFVNRCAVPILKAAGIAALALVLLAGFVGTRDPNRSIAPTLVWIVWWVGFSYLAMLIGNVWPVVNPWRTLFSRFGGRARPQPWPSRIGAWPAVGALLVLGWVELIFPFRASPLVLAWLALAYSAVTWWGMSRYGVDAWLENVDPFHRVFELFSRFAPFVLSPDGKLVLRPYAAGLLERSSAAVSTPHVAFVLAMLAIVLFDGFQASVHWVAIEDAVHAVNPQLGDAGWVAVHSAGLLAMWLVFLGLYLMACRFARAGGGGDLGTLDYARNFAPTLIPIAVGYHFAHTFSYLLVQGQSLVFLVSDPLGLGWNLFGTAGAEMNEAVVATKTAWYLALSAIVVGHAISVWLAHAAAERLLAGRGRPLRALTPITVLMVLYTVISLQILAEPLVRYSGPQETII